MGEIIIKGWETLQSYKDRKPLWIRLHKTLLDDFEFHSMSADARALLPMLWLLASEDKDPKSGRIPLNIERIAFRLRLDVAVLRKALDECQTFGFIVCNESVTEVLQQHANFVTTETETETETETKRIGSEKTEKQQALAEISQPDESASAPNKYAFDGVVVKVTRKDLGKWEDRFPCINVIEHLKGIDKTYAARIGTPDETKNVSWFFSAQSALHKANAENKSKRPEGEAWL